MLRQQSTGGSRAAMNCALLKGILSTSSETWRGSNNLSKLSIPSCDHVVRRRYRVLGLTATQPAIHSGSKTNRLVWMTSRAGKAFRTSSRRSVDWASVNVTCGRHSSGSIRRKISSMPSRPESMAITHFTLTEPDKTNACRPHHKLSLGMNPNESMAWAHS